MREVNREATRKWWKKWWWVIALTGIGSAIVQYKVCEVTEKPVNEYGSPNTPTIADFADEIVKWVSIIEVDDKFKDLEKEYSLDVLLDPYDEIVLKDISYRQEHYKILFKKNWLL